ncbi:unnamed protein product [Microthlaspi erraticum]|uniref:Uncharacterized protein n=1 Tax=Microthlaspi erraticum TaxID=1685480 RepID=A0A6D2IY56_9BRAS|nr:unnamed protein product [Microthlaspi erraticum]
MVGRDGRPDDRVVVVIRTVVAGWFLDRPGRSDGKWIGRCFSRSDAGRSFPARTAPSAVVRELACAAARLYSPARAAWSCAARRGRLWRGRPRDIASRVVTFGRADEMSFCRDFRRTESVLAKRGTFVSRPAVLRGLSADSR